MKLDSQNNTKFPNRVIKRAHEINWNSIAYSKPIALYFLVFTVQITVGIDNNYSPKWRWIVVKFNEAEKRRGKFTTTIHQH